jgi:hypothetical protein
MEAELQDANLKLHHGDDADTLDEMETTTTLTSQFQSVVGPTLQNAAPTDVSTRGSGRQERPPRNGKFYYYACIYDIVSTADHHHGAIPALNHLRTKVVKLNWRRLETTMSDTEASDLLHGEHPTLYQLIRRHKRNATRLIRNMRDGNGNFQTSPSGIATAFTTFFQAKYTNIEADPVSVQTLATLICTETPRDTDLNNESPFTHTEIHTAITSGGQNRAPG